MVTATELIGAVVLSAARPWDQDQFRRFYDATARGLWSYLARAGRDGSLADDLFQEAYLRFLRAAMDGRVQEDRAKQYLFQIAANLVRDHYRRPPTEALSDATGAAHAEGIDLKHDLSRAMGMLTPKERDLLWLAYVERFSHREIAVTVGIKEQSVRPLLFRARNKLADLLRKAGLGASHV